MKNLVLLSAFSVLFLSGSSQAEGYMRYYLLKRTEPLIATSKEPSKEPPTQPEIAEEKALTAHIVQDLWFGPAVAFDFFLWESRSHDYRLGLSPGIGYGIKWSPSWWRATESFIALDLFVQMNAVTVEDGSLGYFNVDFVPAVSFLDWFGVGVGPRLSLPLKDSLEAQTTALVSFGIRKAI